jgi:hypothetical protein
MYHITDFFTAPKSHKTEFPENYREEYLYFISEVTKQIVGKICKATEDKISNANKIEYRRWIGSENILQDTTEISWQEKVKSGNDNKKTVSWAENIKQ